MYTIHPSKLKSFIFNVECNLGFISQNPLKFLRLPKSSFQWDFVFSWIFCLPLVSLLIYFLDFYFPLVSRASEGWDTSRSFWVFNRKAFWKHAIHTKTLENSHSKKILLMVNLKNQPLCTWKERISVKLSFSVYFKILDITTALKILSSIKLETVHAVCEHPVWKLFGFAFSA